MLTLLTLTAFATDVCSLDRMPDAVARRDAVERCARVVSAASWNEGRTHGLTPEALQEWSRDEDLRVRVATHHLIASAGSAELFPAGTLILAEALEDGPRRTRRSALAALPEIAARRMLESGDAWSYIHPQLHTADAPVGAAARALGRLAPVATHEIAPETAREVLVDLLDQRPEAAWRFWFRWRESLPLQGPLAQQLLAQTVGLHGGLLRFWAKEDPETLAALLTRWSAQAPPWRVRACQTFLSRAPERVRSALPAVAGADPTP
jgi:hypothetical protein